MKTKRSYQMPRLADYGGLVGITLGSGGGTPDFDANSFQHINNNANCTVDPAHPQYICFSDGGQILGGFS